MYDALRLNLRRILCRTWQLVLFPVLRSQETSDGWTLCRQNYRSSTVQRSDEQLNRSRLLVVRHPAGQRSLQVHMSSEDAIVDRLDTLIVIMRLAFADAITRAREILESDAAKVAILDCCSGGWTPSAVVRGSTQKLGISESTLKIKISDLIASGLLERRGATKTVEYRSRGIL